MPHRCDSLSLIAERQHLPLAYLEQLFVPLRRAGLVESARGRLGGYRLAKRACDISIAAVMAAVEEETRFTRCTDNDPRCSAATPCLTHGLWNALSEATSEFMAAVSLADVIRGGKYSARPIPVVCRRRLPRRRSIWTTTRRHRCAARRKRR